MGGSQGGSRTLSSSQGGGVKDELFVTIIIIIPLVPTPPGWLLFLLITRGVFSLSFLWSVSILDLKFLVIISLPSPCLLFIHLNRGRGGKLREVDLNVL